MLVAGEAQRRRGLGRIQGHLRVPLIKATLLTYFTRALLDSRVLAVGNGGAALLRGGTPADPGNGVRLTPGRTRGGGRLLTKLNRAIQSSPTVTKTQTLSTFYSQLNRWFWLGFDPLDRATRVLQL
jgi:hypothetical protein